MNIVLDANIFVSAFITSGNAKKIVKQLWLQEKLFDVIASEATLSELGRVLNYPRIRKLIPATDEEVQEYVDLIINQSIVVYPQQKLDLVSDESDNRYIECAVAGSANYLVTGDKNHLLPIKVYKGIKIISPATFLALVDAGL